MKSDDGRFFGRNSEIEVCVGSVRLCLCTIKILILSYFLIKVEASNLYQLKVPIAHFKKYQKKEKTKIKSLIYYFCFLKKRMIIRIKLLKMHNLNNKKIKLQHSTPPP